MASSRLRWLGAALPLVAVVIALVFAATQSRSTAFQTEAIGEGPVADAAAGRICQADTVPAGRPFDGIAFFAGNRGRRPASMRVRVSAGGRELARGSVTVPEAPRDGSTTLRVGLDERVTGGQDIEVCFRARGTKAAVELYGSANPRYVDPIGTADGKPFGSRLFLVYTGEDRSPLSELGGMLDRATLFRATWLRPWMVWTLAGLVLVAVPLLLALALARSRDVT